ncbi:sensor histidine kinase [Mycolicibacterium arenosum]|uniref:histidine kinase n=1 Tax=Mycolicibacterium arenosum TaxID=2952157 RepID=A0ABT1MFB8_9MYCO|nr:HAMP domain-containing sensor histidine kinase [Mycolicibacterium sp. CAU 1645]MCP9276462.1 HAMP domain-containing histidine kinase [Mycolicibacterium sp. CAU 1645]
MVLVSPSRWTVRTRSTVAATVVVTACLLLAGGALLVVLFTTLERSAQATAASRSAQVVDQLRTEMPADLDRAMMATDSQVGAVQVVDAAGLVVIQSAGGPREPLARRTMAPGSTASFGRVRPDGTQDFWVMAAGVDTPAGPVTVLVGADREPVEGVVNTVALLLGIGGPIAIALVAFGTYRLVGAALLPVERLRALVASITSRRLGERIPVPPADDEVTRLAVTMNDMLDRLEGSQNAQRRFVSDASHELRSPLASINAALELAHRRPELFDQALINDALIPEAQRMQGLVEDLLLLARADEHNDGRRTVDVDLDDIVLAEAERIKGITNLDVETSVAAVRVHGDPRGLSRMVRNLVDNAARHAHKRIRLESRSTGGVAQVVVDDDGTGIPEKDRARVFDRFVRLDSPRDRESGGAGLGLSIVAQLVDAHSGSISIGGSGLGGASFTVNLPLAAAEADGADASSVSVQVRPATLCR